MTNSVSMVSKRALVALTTVATVVMTMGTAFIQPAAAASVAAGTLIKSTSQSAVYYYAADGQRYVFPNQNTYKTWYPDFSTVQTLSDADVAAIPLGGNITYRSGTRLIKVTSAPDVYAVTPGGTRQKIGSESVAAALYGSTWATLVDDVPDAFFTNYKKGSDVTTAVYPTGSLVKESGSADVYYIDGNSKRMVTSTGMSLNNFRSEFVRTAASLSSYSLGTSITGKESALADLVAGAGVASGSGLTASLSAATPAAASAPCSAANIVFAKVNLSAAADGAVSITGLKVTRTGLSADSDLSAVKVFDGGVQQSNNQTLNAAHQAVFTFANPIVVAAGSTKELTLAGSIADVSGTCANSGHQITLGLASNADITTSGASVVNGTFPMYGNPVSVVSTGIGSATLTPGSNNPTSDNTPDVGTQKVNLLSVQVQAGSNEDIQLTQFTAIKSGSVTSEDVQNIELYDESTATSLATLPSWSGDRAVFDLSASPITITKGNTHTLTVRCDIIGGSDRTVSAQIKDGSTATLMVRGVTYGFGIEPTFSGSWGAGNGKAVAQTIGSGTLTFIKSTNTPATGNIPQGGTIVTLGAFDVQVRGEPINVTALTLYNAGSTTYSNLTSVALYDANGNVVAGPVDTNSSQYIPYTNSITFPVGTNTYYVKGNINSSATGTVQIRITPNVAASTSADGVTGTGSISGNDITGAPASAVSTNVMTIQTGALTSLTLTTPPASTIIIGQQGVELANFQLNASSSGEDIRITSITVGHAVSGAGTLSDFINLVVKKDGVTQQTTNNTSSPTAATQQFTFQQPIVVPKGQTVVLKLYGDLKSSAASTGTNTWDLDAVTATGVSTNATISTSPSGSGQAMTHGSSGALTVATDSSTLDADIVVAGSSTNIATFRFTTTSESIRLQTILITRSGGANADFGGLTLMDGSTALATGQLGASGTFTYDIRSQNVVIPAYSSKKLTVKADINSLLDGSAAGDAPKITIATAGDVTGVGIASGSAVASTGTATTTNAMTIFRTKPTVALVSLGNTTLADGTLDLLKFTVAADPAGDIDVYKITPNCNLSGVTVGDIQVFDVTGASEQTLFATGTACSGETAMVLSSVKSVAQGTTRTFLIRGTVSGTSSGDSLQVKLAGDSAAATAGTPASGNTNIGTAAEMDTDSNDNFIWSDYSEELNGNGHSTSTDDWTNGYLVKTLPTANNVFSKA